MFRIATIADEHFDNYDDRMIAMFYELTCSNLNDCERKRAGKGKKTAKFEHCDNRMFLVSINTRIENINIRCNQSILTLLYPVPNQPIVLLFDARFTEKCT